MKWIVGEEHLAHIARLSKSAKLIELNVAFLTDSGSDLVLDLAKHTAVDLTVSAYMRATKKASLQRLLAEMEGKSARGVNLRVRVAAQLVQGYHGKVYAFHYHERPTAWIVGSANLTAAGLTGKGDVSILIEGGKSSFPWSTSYEKQLKLTEWAKRGNVKSLVDFLESYSENEARGGPYEEEHTKILQIVGVRDATKDEEDFVNSAQEADTTLSLSIQGDIHESDDCWLLISNTKADAIRYRTLDKARVGDVLIRSWEGKKVIDAFPIKALIRGRRVGRSVVVAVLDSGRRVDIPSKEQGPWRNKILHPDEIPKTLKKRLVKWPNFI